MLVIGVPGAEAALQRLEAARETKSRSALDRSMLTHFMGTVNHTNTGEPKAFERKGFCLCSAKKPAQKHSTQVPNASLPAMS